MTEARVQVYEYPAMAWEGYPAGMSDLFRDTDQGRASTAEESSPVKETAVSSAWKEQQEQDLARRLAEECRKAEERGRKAGVETGYARAREEAGHQLAAERNRLQSQTAALMASYASDREQYFERVEEESVRLALAIAARILRREAQMDPLLLCGAVRVALGQLAESTSVKLYVPRQDLALWEEAVRLIPGLRIRPAVLADEHMELGECRVETAMGSTDLGLKAQLREIERGFFDRVGRDAKRAGSGTENGEGSTPSEKEMP